MAKRVYWWITDAGYEALNQARGEQADECNFLVDPYRFHVEPRLVYGDFRRVDYHRAD